MSIQNPEIPKSFEHHPLKFMSAEQEKMLKRELEERDVAGIAHQEYSALFLPLGIMRTLREGIFSEEERKRALRASETEIRAFFGHHTDLFFTQKMWGDALENPSNTNIDTCVDAIAKNIRAWAEFCRKYADVQEIKKESEKRTGEGDFQDPLYYFITHQEPLDIADGLKFSSLQRLGDSNEQERYFIYAIQYAQHLAGIVEKLAPRIKNGDVEIDIDIEDIQEIIKHAKESLVRALQERDHEADATSLPKIDTTQIDNNALEKLEKIAQALKEQKVAIG